jgi:Tol biopolymer transport system component
LEAVREQLQRILDTEQFARAESLKRLLSVLVEQTLAGREDELNEYFLGQEVFGRGDQFDPKSDTIVRVQTRRLRARLDAYYQTQGCNDTVVFSLPKGRYEVVVAVRDSPPREIRAAERRRPSVVRKSAIRFGLAIGCIAAGSAFFYMTGGAPTPALKVVPLTTFPGWESEPAFSPNGRQIAFAWNGEGPDNFDIYIKSIDSDVPLRLTGHPGEDRNPVWSPDGQRIAFVRRFQGEDAVFIAPILGGPERKVHDLTRPLVLCPLGVSCLSWSPDGDSLAIVDKTAPEDPQSVFVLSLNTLQLRRLTYPSAGQPWGDVCPSFSPDGTKLAFVRWNTTGSDVFVTSVNGGEPERVTSDMRMIFSVDWTPDGRELVFSSDGSGNPGIWMVPVSEGRPRLLVTTTEGSFLSVARKAKRLAYAKVGIRADWNIWRTDLKNPAHPSTRLIASTQQDMSPEFSPDGSRIVFNSTRSGSYEIWMCDRDGRNQVQLTAFAGPHAGSPRWSPDGRRVAFDARSTRLSGADIYVIDIDARLPDRLTSEDSEEITPCWSEDGRWIYFGSTRSGDWQLWKMPAQGGKAERVTRSGGVITIGVRDGFVYYLKSMEAKIWRVPEEGGREEAILSTPEFHYSRYSALGDGGIYFLSPVGAYPVPRMISFLNFDTGRITEIVEMKGKPLVWEPGISVSADGRWMLYSQVDEEAGDITLVENLP